MHAKSSRQLVICLDNEGYAASLERLKIYISIPDPEAETRGLRRVVDESRDDYLYPTGMFRLVALPADVEKAILSAM